MFLDDKMLNICENAIINNSDDVRILATNIYKECEVYFKSKVYKDMPNKELKSILDKTFNLFDSFVRNAEKSDNKQLQILGDLFKDHTFKKQFLSNKDMYRVYFSL